MRGTRMNVMMHHGRYSAQPAVSHTQIIEQYSPMQPSHANSMLVISPDSNSAPRRLRFALNLNSIWPELNRALTSRIDAPRLRRG